MKTKIGFLVILLIAGIFAANAQGGQGFQRHTVEERVKNVNDKIADLKLDKNQLALTDSIFTDYYKAQDKTREDMMASGGQFDRDKMRETMQKFADDRDEKLKKIWSEAQFKKFKDEIETTLRPQKPAGGGNN
ncbi:MAG: hypothetical protein M3O67_06465 [Bacteroidota bacterium]|nr:hypothetical protein [Bacteroidota bacterium]